MVVLHSGESVTDSHSHSHTHTRIQCAVFPSFSVHTVLHFLTASYVALHAPCAVMHRAVLSLLALSISDHGWHLGEYAMWEKRTNVRCVVSTCVLVNALCIHSFADSVFPCGIAARPHSAALRCAVLCSFGRCSLSLALACP
jgi:hypothetical protein